MDFTPGVRALQRFWLAIVAVGIVGLAVAYGASYLLSPTYAATSRVLLQAHDVSYLNGNGQNLGTQNSLLDSTLAKSLTETSSGIITSSDVATQVVDDLHLDVPKPLKTDLFSVVKRTFKNWYTVAYAYFRYGFYSVPPARQGAIASTQQALSANVVQDSYLIDITARADDPELAAAMANSATRAFINVSQARTQQDATRYSDDLKQQVDTAQAAVQSAQDAVRQYRQDNNITDISEQSRLAAGAIDQARKDLSDVQAQLQAANAQQDALQASLATLNPTDTTTTSGTITSNGSAPQTVNSTSTVNTAPSDTTVQTGRGSTTTSAAGGSTTTRNDTTISQDTNTQTTQDLTTEGPNRVYQDQLSASLSLAAQIKALEARQASLEQTLQSRSSDSSALPAMDATLSNLQLQLTTAQGVYVQLENQYESARANIALVTQAVSVVSNATPPTYPEKPLRWLFALVGLLVGLMLGVGLAYYLDGRGGGARRVGGYRLPGFGEPFAAPAPRAAVASPAPLGTTIQPGAAPGGSTH